MSTKICHITSIHRRYDVRIFRKQCQSLYKAGYDVSLVVADGKGDEIKDGIKIYDAGKFEGRFNRMVNAAKSVGKRALELDCEVYHFHDPELIFAGLKIKKAGKKVIFDMHENIPADIDEKSYIPSVFRKIISFAYSKLEIYTVKRIDAVVSTRESINERLQKYTRNIEIITNFPIADQQIEKHQTGKKEICFAGIISPKFGHKQIINAVENIPGITYHLVGEAVEPYLEELKTLPGWKNVQYEGHIPFEKVKEMYSEASIGVAVYAYSKNFDGKLGNLAIVKLFEYMNWGIPVICTDFKVWKEIVEEEVQCGITVNPDNEEDIRNAVQYILDNPEKAKQMGENGRKAVLEKYNWETQARKLRDLYKKVLR